MNQSETDEIETNNPERAGSENACAEVAVTWDPSRDEAIAQLRAAAELGGAIAAADLVGADAEDFLQKLRARHPRPAPIMPPRGGAN